MTATLQGKTAIVTGAGSGIGRAVALRYAAAGANVVVSDVDEAGGAATVAAIEERGGAGAFARADVAVAKDNERLVETAVARYGALHVACNNAGIGGAQAPTGEYPIEGWDRVIAINLSGVFYGMRYQIPAMIAAGGGAIVNMASILAQVGFRNSCAYVAAKHGVVGLTKNAALEHAPQRVRVNAVGPGFIRTPLIETLPAETLQTLEQLHPLGRLGEADEVATLVAWLSSDEASFVTGAYVPVDGGYLAQ